MRGRVLAFAVLLVLAACSRITEENFSKIRNGMTEQEVYAILGSPAESSSTNVLGISGTSAKWSGGDASISVRFVNGKVALKSFDKPAGKQR